MHDLEFQGDSRHSVSLVTLPLGHLPFNGRVTVAWSRVLPSRKRSSDPSPPGNGKKPRLEGAWVDNRPPFGALNPPRRELATPEVSRPATLATLMKVLARGPTNDPPIKSLSTATIEVFAHEVKMGTLIQNIFTAVVPRQADEGQHSSSWISPPSSSHFAIDSHSFRDVAAIEGAEVVTSSNRAKMEGRARGKSLLDVVVSTGSRSPVNHLPVQAEQQ